MNFIWEDLEPTKKKLKVEVPAETVTDRIQKASAQVRRNAKFKGFRPGKAPLAMIKRMYGAQIEQEVTQELINESVKKALDETEYELAAAPNLEESDYKDGEPYRFTLSLEIKPQFDISGYDGIELSRDSVNVTVEMIDERLEQFRQAYATTKNVEEDRPLKEGDLALIDYQAFVDGEPLEGGVNPNYQLEVGSGVFNEDFESELVGLSKDENKEITVTFDEKYYNPKLAGKEVRFEVKVIDIKEKILPDLNDEFAKDLGGEFENLDDLKKQVEEDLTKVEERRVEEALQSMLKEKLSDLIELDIPESMVQRELESMVANMKFNLERSGLSLETASMPEEKLKEEYHPTALKQVKTSLILERITREKKLSVTEEELQNRMLRIAQESGQPPEKILELYNQNHVLASLRRSMLEEKTLNNLLENAIIQVTVSPFQTGENEMGEKPEKRPEE